MKIINAFLENKKLKKTIKDYKTEIIVVFFIPLILFIFPLVVGVEETKVSKDIAIEALKSISDLTKWLALIQIGIIGSFPKLYDKDNSDALEQNLAFLSVLFLGTGLFFSAWVLSSIPSIMLRVSKGEMNDIFMFPIYGWLDKPLLKWFDLGWFVSVQHWYWAIGTLLFAAFIFKKFIVSAR